MVVIVFTITNVLAFVLIGWVGGWVGGWVVGWLAGWLVGWLVGCWFLPDANTTIYIRVATDTHECIKQGHSLLLWPFF